MISHNIIKSEMVELKKILCNGEVVVPSFWACIKPGVILLAWLVVCPYVFFSISGAVFSDTLSAVGFSGFFGFMIAFAIFNARSLLLAIPKEFRDRSVVIQIIQGKAKKYLAVYMMVILLLSILGAYSDTAALGYLLPMVFVTGVIAMVFNSDVNRYRLSAFTGLVKGINTEDKM